MDDLTSMARDTFVAACNCLPSQEVLSYVILILGLYWLMAPNPAAFSRPRINKRAIRNADWRAVGWEKRVAELKTGKQYVIIGAGFVGRKLIHSLLLRGETKITAFDMDPHACDQFKNDSRVKFIRGDVTKYDQLVEAVRGADVVYATFAIIRFMDNLDHQAALSYRINVDGTNNVIRACQECGVKILVQTSTGNVALDGETCDLHMDEKTEYVTRENSPNHYGWTKAIAEQLVLKADKVNGVRTGAIRPCSAVFGAQDRHFLDVMLNLGRTILPPNGGSAVMDMVSVMNVVWGHLLLEDALWKRADDGVAGEAFCISNEHPIRMVDFCALINEFRPGGITVIPTPEKLLIGLSYIVELAAYLKKPFPGQLGQLTRATIRFLDMSYVFSSRKARDCLGYEPIFSMEDAMQMSVEEWQIGDMLPLLPS